MLTGALMLIILLAWGCILIMLAIVGITMLLEASDAGDLFMGIVVFLCSVILACASILAVMNPNS